MNFPLKNEVTVSNNDGKNAMYDTIATSSLNPKMNVLNISETDSCAVLLK